MSSVIMHWMVWTVPLVAPLSRKTNSSVKLMVNEVLVPPCDLRAVMCSSSSSYCAECVGASIVSMLRLFQVLALQQYKPPCSSCNLVDRSGKCLLRFDVVNSMLLDSDQFYSCFVGVGAAV